LENNGHHPIATGCPSQSHPIAIYFCPEQTRITIGEKPPTVMVNLPDTITVGKAYKYEAVVQDRLMMIYL
jgi:hypothetical protein